MNRYTVLDQARSWIGRKESDGSHKAIIDVYNSHKPLARGYKVKYTDSWCATFVSAVAIAVGATDIIPLECSCNQMIKKAQGMHIWCESDGYIPKPGDIVMYDWQDSGVGDNKGSADHVGIVESVGNKVITVIEGNKNDSVSRRSIKVNGRYIRGFITPNYSTAVVPTANAAPEPVPPAHTPAPSAPAPKSSKPTYSVGSVYTVVASDLIVRKTPGGAPVGHSGLTANAKANDRDKDGALDRGTRVTCKEVRSLGNAVWLRCPSGWICGYTGSSIYVK